MATTVRPARTDPVTLSVILNRFHGIAQEMTLVLEHTAWSSVLNMARDYSCAVYDAKCRQVCTIDGLPIHTTSQHLVLEEIARSFGDQVYDGDIFVCNDPYRNNTHVGDVVAAKPVFAEGRLMFWTVTKAHHIDIGAFAPASIVPNARTVWQEGLQIPPIKFIERGEVRSDVVGLFLANVRYRDALEGDLLAQFGSVKKGAERLVELCSEFGAEVTEQYIEAIIDYTDRRMSEEIRRIPDGEYEAEAWMDSDGCGTADVPIRVKVTVTGDGVCVDFTGSGPQARGSMNGTYGTSMAAAGIPFMYYIDPDIPHNHGCIRHIEVIAPKGSICNAEYPASTSCATLCPSAAMEDAVNRAMASVIPERVPAGGPRSGAPQLTGWDPVSGGHWGTLLFNSGGGLGAVAGCDGWPLIGANVALGGLKSLPIEQIELLYPLLVDEMEVERDTMGFGCWVGGPGLRMAVRPHGCDGFSVITFGDGWRNPPHGVLGGMPGGGGVQYVEGDDDTRRFFSANGSMRVEVNGRWVGVSTGGGGYGSPVDRDAEQVRQDVRDGFLSREAARDVFGVILTEGMEPVVDSERTSSLRSQLAARPRPPLDPTGPNASKWLQQAMREGDEYLLDPPYELDYI